MKRCSKKIIVEIAEQTSEKKSTSYRNLLKAGFMEPKKDQIIFLLISVALFIKKNIPYL
jgi:hypothetical protein